MAKSYAVDSFHINIGTGDAAIHLLVESSDPSGVSDPDPGATPKPTILRSALIDGGEYQKNVGASDIRDTIANIKKRYELGVRDSEGDGRMRFDSIMVSHWDSDHYGGVKKLLEDDFTDMLEAYKSLTTAEQKRELEAKQSRYCRYGKADKSVLLTTFYAPYWDEDFKNGDPLTKKRKPAKAPAKASTPDNPVELQREGATPDKYTLRFDYTLVKESKSVPGVTANIGQLCNIRSETHDVIGSNILDNGNLVSRGSKKLFRDIARPIQLVDELKGTQLEDPSDFAPVGIYCIASKGYVMGRIEPFLKNIKVRITKLGKTPLQERESFTVLRLITHP